VIVNSENKVLQTERNKREKASEKSLGKSLGKSEKAGS
jgi:hypothetical protein